MIHSNTVAGRSPRGTVIGARSVIGRRAAKCLAAAMVSGLCVGGAAAAAEPLAPTQVEGRWVNVRQNLTLDISRCGEGWCGVEVRDSVCAKTALRITARSSPQVDARFEGRLALADRAAAPYTVMANLYVHEGVIRLQLLGNLGDKPDLLRRWYPLNEQMARSGPPQCKPDATVS